MHNYASCPNEENISFFFLLTASVEGAVVDIFPSIWTSDPDIWVNPWAADYKTPFCL